MNRFCLAVGFVLIVWAARIAAAQDTDRPQSVLAPPGTESAATEPATTEPESEKPWYLWGSVDFRSQYFFRGYLQNNEWYIIQPNAEFGYTVYDNGSFALTPFVGTWMNFTRETGTTSPEHFNEIDGIGGVDFILKQNLTLRLIYTDYSSPSDSFGSIQELGLAAKYEGLPLGPFEKLNPGVGVYQELQDTAETEHTYMEFGLEPTLKEIKLGKVPLTLSFPSLLGTSLDTYYTNSSGSNAFWGYLSVGIRGVVPLPVPEKYGKWFLAAELDYLYLLADSVQETNGGDDDDFAGSVSLVFQF